MKQQQDWPRITSSMVQDACHTSQQMENSSNNPEKYIKKQISAVSSSVTVDKVFTNALSKFLIQGFSFVFL